MMFADGKSFVELLFAPAEAPKVGQQLTAVDSGLTSLDLGHPDDFVDGLYDEEDEDDSVGYVTYTTSANDDFIVWQTGRSSAPERHV